MGGRGIVRWLINYIRECFCKHEFECTTGRIYKHYPNFGESVLVTIATMYCKKCGYKKTWAKGD